MGVEVSVLTTDSYALNACDQSWIADYSRHYKIQVLPHRGPKGFGYSPGFATAFRREAQRHDVIHVHNLWGYTNLLSGWLCRSLGVPFVVSTHGMLDPHSVGRKRWKKRWYGRFVEWPALRRASGLLFTHAEEERLARLSASKLPRGFVVPLGTSDPPLEERAELAEPFLSAYPLLRDKRIVLFLGRLHPKKGLDILIPAFAKFLHSAVSANSDVHLVLAGPGEADYNEQLRRLVTELGIGHATTFTGSLQGHHKWGALAAAELFVLPSYQENFAISVVESLRVGTPVILSDRVNIAGDLRAAGVAAHTDLCPDDLSRVIDNLLANPERSHEMGRRGREFALSHYSWNRSCRSLISAYQSVLDRPVRE